MSIKKILNQGQQEGKKERKNVTTLESYGIRKPFLCKCRENGRKTNISFYTIHRFSIEFESSNGLTVLCDGIALVSRALDWR